MCVQCVSLSHRAGQQVDDVLVEHDQSLLRGGLGVNGALTPCSAPGGQSGVDGRAVSGHDYG